MMEKYLTSPAAIWTLFIALAAFSGALVDGVGRLVWKFKDMGRTWVITAPTVPGTKGDIRRVKITRDQFTKKEPVNGDEYETFIRASAASFPTAKGPVLIMTDYGANLVAPTKDEAAQPGDSKAMRVASEEAARRLQEAEAQKIQLNEEEKKTLLDRISTYVRFRVADPLIYWRATRENDQEDLYAAQREKDHWAVKLAPVAIILFIGLMAMLGFILWKVYPLLEAAGR